MQSIEIDRRKRLSDEPGTGRNRFHPDIPPLLEVGEGKGGARHPGMASTASLALTPPKRILRISGGLDPPAHRTDLRQGAQPGDVLEVEFLDILPQAQAFSAILPGFGFLRDVCLTPFWCTGTSATAGPPRPNSRCAYPRGAVYGHFCSSPFACATARLGSQGTGAD